MQERRNEKKYVGKFLEDDYDKFQQDFLSLLKDYKRKTQRLDKIIKQSDKQQFQMLKVNEELEEYKEKLEVKIENDKVLFQKSRQAQMGEMISMIAHQWRQPLASISGTIVGMQLAQKDTSLNLSDTETIDKLLSKQDEKFTRINNQVKALSSTIDDFRDFFKPNKPKELIDISIPIQKAVSMVVSDFLNKDITITTNYNAKIQINIYVNEIIQVILNLLQNSEENFLLNNIKNCTIDIKTAFDNNNNPYITIQDNGGGIKDEVLEKIFDPYFSTKDEKNGTGLGLYMSKMIIEEHNHGELLATNTQDGICFRISWIIA